jgi:hypothetical protein
MSVYYAQLGTNNKVMAVTALHSKVDYPHLIEISEQDYETRNLLGCLYSPQAGFYGLKIKVESDKQSIISDGIDELAITASLVNFTTGVVEPNQDRYIVFKLNDKESMVEQTQNGVAQIIFTSDEKGEYTIYATNGDTDIIENGQVKVTVV